ncbi:MAG TPA: glutathione S-transferase N-terminal domain-containing protein [Hyphomicrobiales bacterium]|nr:glutathione S-transferase N-terminal domain-containing protein [Hyphomicrobiales bacterium]
MIDLYYGPTANCRKVSIMLEETGLPYTLHAMDMLAGDQLKPDYLAVNPNNKIPAIVDRDGPGGQPVTIWESGAILIYLAEKTGRFLPADPGRRIHCLQWLMFQMAGIGPMFGQWVHFNQYAPEPIPYAVERYRREIDRLRLVVDGRLADHRYLVDEYSIADIACWPWLQSFRTRLPPAVPTPHLDAWADRIAERPAAMRGLQLLADRVRPEAKGEKPVDAHTWNVLYGTMQHGERYRDPASETRGDARS